jgi:hypothetical protein
LEFCESLDDQPCSTVAVRHRGQGGILKNSLSFAVFGLGFSFVGVFINLLPIVAKWLYF